MHYFLFIDLFYHLYAKFQAFPFKVIWGYKSVGSLGLDVVFDSPCVSYLQTDSLLQLL